MGSTTADSDQSWRCRVPPEEHMPAARPCRQRRPRKLWPHRARPCGRPRPSPPPASQWISRCCFGVGHAVVGPTLLAPPLPGCRLPPPSHLQLAIGAAHHGAPRAGGSPRVHLRGKGPSLERELRCHRVVRRPGGCADGEHQSQTVAQQAAAPASGNALLLRAAAPAARCAPAVPALWQHRLKGRPPRQVFTRPVQNASRRVRLQNKSSALGIWAEAPVRVEAAQH